MKDCNVHTKLVNVLLCSAPLNVCALVCELEVDAGSHVQDLEVRLGECRALRVLLGLDVLVSHCTVLCTSHLSRGQGPCYRRMRLKVGECQLDLSKKFV